MASVIGSNMTYGMLRGLVRLGLLDCNNYGLCGSTPRFIIIFEPTGEQVFKFVEEYYNGD